MQINEDATPAEKRILREYYSISQETKVRGSALHRLIAQNLFYKIDKNNTNAFVSRTLSKYL